MVKRICIFLLLTIHISCEESSESPEETVTLDFKNSFPKTDDEVLLANPVNFAMNDSLILISDQQLSQILTFDKDGEFLREIGSPGSGPGEFKNPHKMVLYDNLLFINDQGNSRILIKTIEGDSKIYSNVDEPPLNFEATDEYLYVANAILPHDTESEDVDLITKYDHDFNSKKAFGNFLSYLGGLPPVASSNPLLNVYDDKFYVTFPIYPEVQIYSSEGELMENMDLETVPPSYKQKVPENFDAASFTENALFNREEGPQTLIQNFEVNKQGIFLQLYDEKKILIDQYDHSGKFIQRFSRDSDFDSFSMRDMEVVTHNDSKRFYFLKMSDQYPLVSVYKQ